jgi:hypothetical protein
MGILMVVRASEVKYIRLIEEPNETENRSVGSAADGVHQVQKEETVVSPPQGE